MGAFRDLLDRVTGRSAPSADMNPVAAAQASVVESVREFYYEQHRDYRQEDFTRLLEKYGQSVWVYIAVNRIANAAAQIPLVLMDLEKEDKPGQQVASHDYGLKDLLRKPNEWQSGFDFMEAGFLSLELAGNWYIDKSEMNSRGRPERLYCLHPGRVTIFPDSKNKIHHYEYEVNGKPVPYGPDEIIHIKYANPANDYFGLAPLTAARMAIETDTAAAKWNQNFLDRGGWPVGALVTPNKLEKDNLARLRRQVKDLIMRGKDTAGLVMILDGGLDFKALNANPKDIDWLAARQLSRDQILAIFGVPFAVAGLFSTEQTTARSAGVIQQVKNFYLFTMFPKMEKVRSALNIHLTPHFSTRFEIQTDFRGVPALADDVEQEKIKSETFKNLVNSGWCINDANAYLYPHMKAVPWGKLPWVNSSMIQVDGKGPVNEPLALPPPAPSANGNGNGASNGNGKPPADPNEDAVAAAFDRIRRRAFADA